MSNMNNSLPFCCFFLLLYNYACALCFSPFITFDNVRSSFTKRQDMFPVILAMCFVLFCVTLYHWQPWILQVCDITV